MLAVKIKKKIVEKSEIILKKINLGQRGIADGNYEEQKIGLIGQLTIYDLLNIEPQKFRSSGFDGGYDLILNNKKIDIKTMGRKVKMKDHYVHNFIGLQKEYENDLYIFCSYNKTTEMLEICGWISKKDFFEKCKFYKKGTKRYRDDGTFFPTKADLYEIENSKLISIKSKEGLGEIGRKN